VERTLAFTFVHDRIAVIDITTDPVRAARLEITFV
jgi:RNA polymerase sigma-70 factor (ECF subfamily)